jgi:hypothetical protein
MAVHINIVSGNLHIPAPEIDADIFTMKELDMGRYAEFCFFRRADSQGLDIWVKFDMEFCSVVVIDEDEVRMWVFEYGRVYELFHAICVFMKYV